MSKYDIIVLIMNDEIIPLLKEIRDLQKESVENQKKALEQVRVQQKSFAKKVVIIFIVFFVVTVLLNFLR